MTPHNHAVAMRLYLDELCKTDRGRWHLPSLRNSWAALLAACAVAGCSSESVPDNPGPEDSTDGSTPTQDSASDVQQDNSSDVFEGTAVAMYSAPMTCSGFPSDVQSFGASAFGLCAATALVLARRRRSAKWDAQ